MDDKTRKLVERLQAMAKEAVRCGGEAGRDAMYAEDPALKQAFRETAKAINADGKALLDAVDLIVELSDRLEAR